MGKQASGGPEYVTCMRAASLRSMAHESVHLMESFPVLVTLPLVTSRLLFSCDRLLLLLHHFDQPPLHTQADFRQQWPASGQRTRDLVCR
jgi:hypothetical protein